MKAKDLAAVNKVSSGILKEYNNSREYGPKPVLCYAPFKNLYFGLEGEVVSCCYNREYILGTYPQQSIKEIWFGREAERLRQFILNNDLSLGCQNCRYHLYSGNFDAVKSKMFDGHRENSNKYPSTFELELANTCNLECIMCTGKYSSSIRKNREKLPPLKEVYDDRFLNQLKEFIPYLEAIKFYGGEPFLIDIYYRIWDLIARLNPQIRIYIQTSGTVLNNKVREVLAKCNFDISVSTESLAKENYETIRVNGKFETVMENIRYFREYTRQKNTFFGISVCAIRQNWHEIPAFVNFCNRLDAKLYIHTAWYPKHCTFWNLDSIELEKILNNLHSFSAPQSNAVEKMNARHYNDFVRQTEDWLERRKKVEERRASFKTVNEEIYITALFDRIKQYVYGLEGLSDPEKEKKVNQYIDMLQGVMDRIPDSTIREKILRNSHTFSIRAIVSNLEEATIEDMIEKAIAFEEPLYFE